MKLSLTVDGRWRKAAAVALLLLLASAGEFTPAAEAQGRSPFPLGEGPWIFETFSPPGHIKVSVITTGLTHTWGLEFLPNGDFLISERRGTLRIVRDGKLDPEPIAGIPEVAEATSGGLMDIALHPDFENNRWVYFVYAKGGEPEIEGEDYWATTAVGRGRFHGGNELTDVEDVSVPNAWGAAPGGHGTRILFAPDGTFFVAQPHRRELDRAQNPMDHVGTILRLNDDGTVPDDNPFVGIEGFLPEIYSYGHRVVEGLAFHPETGELWASEHGPQGGDEINIIRPGGNYGWPEATYGKNYDGSRPCDGPCSWDGFEHPELVWVPSIAPSGTMFYTGDAFPGWQNNIFVGALRHGGVIGTGHIQRIVYGPRGELRREQLLGELRQRIRDVKQGPDGLIYVITEEPEAALLKIEPYEPD